MSRERLASVLWRRTAARLRSALRRLRGSLATAKDEQVADGSANARSRFWAEFRAGRREAEARSATRRS